MNKYSRICWNTKGWKTPSGSARAYETKGSYVAQYQFGHEEWLFNFDWLLSGYADDQTLYRYGFMQPFNKYLETFMGKSFSVLVYTVTPTSDRCIVARIDDMYVPNHEEMRWAYQQVVSKGWLDDMQQHLVSLGIDSSYLHSPGYNEIINVRFRPSDVTFFDPWPIVDRKHKIVTNSRYHPFDWDDGFPPVTILPRSQDSNDAVHASKDYTVHRRAIEPTTYKRTHVYIQEQIVNYLKSIYPNAVITPEQNYVDIAVIHNGLNSFYELKTHNTAKKCIREAFGQLMEYAYYPGEVFADEIIVVGEAEPTLEDVSYVAFLRDTLGIPLFYSKWDTDSSKLLAKI